MIDLHSNDDRYACVYPDRQEAEAYARALQRDDPYQKWVVSQRKIRAGGATWAVYVVHARR
jgi:hypothetical protein